nr:TylF/MycF/NovP-related O-methyltransferase [uncultured Flavobacterium sp.]
MINNNIDPYEFENGFFKYSKPERLMKAIAHYELYKKIIHLPGAVVECGVFKGNSLIRLATFRQYLETNYSRKIYAFDIFGKFPETNYIDDIKYRDRFIENAGEIGPSEIEINEILRNKGISDNIEYVQGDILKTIPTFTKENPNLRICLLHIDVDLFEPTKTVLEYLYPLIVKGGLVVFDDYNIFPGATKAIEDYFPKESIIKYSSLHTPTYIIK